MECREQQKTEDVRLEGQARAFFGMELQVVGRSASSYIGCLDDVVEHEGMEEDTEENIDVMVY